MKPDAVASPALVTVRKTFFEQLIGQERANRANDG
jgi:hypothetical protein